ncbi:major facilitator superfamily domain-containing protein [Phakopsora pachyrhizi]|nr:major facilitator superfamily domain-containing protein [Phakopsora pachyrhizi]
MLDYQMSQKSPICLRFRSSSTFIITVIDFFLYGIIVPVLPFALKERIGLPEDDVNHVLGLLLTAEALATVLFSPFAGLIADYGNGKRAFLLGLLALCLSTTMLCFGRTLSVLLGARVLQGISAAVVWTVGLSLLIDTVGIQRLGSVFGTIHSTISIGMLSSPLIGGFVYSRCGYYAVYGVSAGLLAMDLVLRLFMIEKSVAKELKKFGIDEGDDDERTVLITNSDQLERIPEPLIVNQSEPLTGLKKHLPILIMLEDPHLLACLLVSFSQATILASFDTILPLHAHSRFGFGSSGSGMLFGALQLSFIFLNPMFGNFADHHGGRVCVVMGFLGLAPLLVLLSIPSEADLITFVIVLVGIGVGLAAVSAPAFVEANLTVSRGYEANRDRFGARGPFGQLYAINNIMFGLGMSVGPMVSSILSDQFGFRAAMIGLATISFGTGLVGFFGIRSSVSQAQLM